MPPGVFFWGAVSSVMAIDVVVAWYVRGVRGEINAVGDGAGFVPAVGYWFCCSLNCLRGWWLFYFYACLWLVFICLPLACFYACLWFGKAAGGGVDWLYCRQDRTGQPKEGQMMSVLSGACVGSLMFVSEWWLAGWLPTKGCRTRTGVLCRGCRVIDACFSLSF